MAEDLFSSTTGSRWMILVVTLGLVSVVGLTVRIWSIERSHRKIRLVLEKRVAQRTGELERAFRLTRRDRACGKQNTSLELRPAHC